MRVYWIRLLALCLVVSSGAFLVVRYSPTSSGAVLTRHTPHAAAHRSLRASTSSPARQVPATARSMIPSIERAAHTAYLLSIRSLACTCDAGTSSAFTGRAEQSLIQRASRLRRLHEHRTTRVGAWRVISAQLTSSTRASVSAQVVETDILYQGMVRIRQVDRSYQANYLEQYAGRQWKVAQVATSRQSRRVLTFSSAPATGAQAVYILDDVSGHPLYGFNADQERYVASTQKMLTALVALRSLSLDQIVTVPSEAIVGGTTANLFAGERMRVRDLFYGMMLPSGNDAAITLADAAAGSIPTFAREMNSEAAILHMTRSHFLIPHGFDVPGQYSTAHDLATLARVVLRQPFLAGVVGTRFYSARSANGATLHSWVNLNELLGKYPGAIGVKTGTTPGAGANLVASAVRGHQRIIVVLLGDSHEGRFPDATRLLNYGWQLLG